MMNHLKWLAGLIINYVLKLVLALALNFFLEENKFYHFNFN